MFKNTMQYSPQQTFSRHFEHCGMRISDHNLSNSKIGGFLVSKETVVLYRWESETNTSIGFYQTS